MYIWKINTQRVIMENKYLKGNYNLLLTEREGRTGNTGPRSWQYGPSVARSVQKRPRANTPQHGSS